MKKLLIASVLAALGTTAQAGVSAPFSDDFNSNTLGKNVSVADWNTNGKVDVFGGATNKYLGLDGGSPKSVDLWKDLNLTKGVEYMLSFDLATALDSFDFGVITVKVGSLLGQIDPPKAYAGEGWAHYQYSFTAKSSRDYRLSFKNTTGHEMFLDNVNVAAVPEPETYAMMLAGLGIVGFMAKRRRSS